MYSYIAICQKTNGEQSMSSVIDTSSLISDMNLMRLKAGNVGFQNINNLPSNTEGVKAADFSSALKQALDGVNELQVTSDAEKARYDMGDRSVSLADVMLHSQKASLALEATVQVRNKMTEAYRTIMQMQF